MSDTPFASRVATRVKVPVVIVGLCSALLVEADLASVVSDVVTRYAAIGVACLAAAMFLCATFDVRFQNAVSAMNAERRDQAREMGRAARRFGWGLPMGDPVLFTMSLILLVEALASANVVHRAPAAGLSGAGFFLTTMTALALMVRGCPTDRFKG